MNDLSAFQRDLLYVITGFDQPSGQDVKNELEGYINGEVNHGQLYPNLDTLVSKEYVEKGPLDRRTNYYAITEKGREALRNRRRWEDQHMAIEA